MINIIFLNYDPEHKNIEMINKSRLSILENSPSGLYEFYEVKDVKGFVNAANIGLQIGREGDYNVFVASDFEVHDKYWLDKMCQLNCFTGWRFNKFFLTGEDFPDCACFCLPKNVSAHVGFFDAIFNEGYGFDDNDYTYRCLEAGYHIYNAQVSGIHHENKTYSSYFKKDEKERMTARNQELFITKWKEKYPLIQR